MEIQLKRNQNILAVTGAGVAVFGFWSVVKTIMYCVLSPEAIEAMLLAELETNPDIPLGLLTNTFYLVLGVIFLMDLAIRLFICICARAQAQGRERGNAYIIMTGVMLMTYLALFIYNASAFYGATSSVLDTAISILIELTSIYTLFELMVSAIRVKKLTKIRKG